MQVQNVAVPVSQDLHFDVPRAADEALEKHGVISERRSSLGARFLQARLQRLRVLHHAHAAPAAAERRLHHQWISDFVRDALRIVFLRDRLLGPWNYGEPRFLRQTPRRRLIAQQIEQIRARPDERNARGLARARQRRIFREKTVAGMDRVDAPLLRQRHDSIDVEIRLHGPLALADQISFVGLEPMQAEAVFVRKHGDRANLQFIGGAEDANGDFAAI